MMRKKSFIFALILLAAGGISYFCGYRGVGSPLKIVPSENGKEDCYLDEIPFGLNRYVDFCDLRDALLENHPRKRIKISVNLWRFLNEQSEILNRMCAENHLPSDSIVQIQKEIKILQSLLQEKVEREEEKIRKEGGGEMGKSML